MSANSRYRAVRYLQEIGPAVEGCGGNKHTWKACCIGADFGVDMDWWWSEVQAWNEYNQPPFTPQELRGIFDSSLRNRKQQQGAKLEGDREIEAPMPEVRHEPPPRREVFALWRQLGTDPSWTTDYWEGRATPWWTAGPPQNPHYSLARHLHGKASMPSWASIRGESWSRAGYSTIIPLFDCHGKLASVKARWSSRESPPATAKSLTPTGFANEGFTMLSEPAVEHIKSGTSAKRVFVVEGEPDFLYTTLHNPDFVVVGIFSGSLTQGWSRVLAGATIISCLHSDKAGEEYHRRLKELCRDSKIIRAGAPRGNS